jgi:hypothetical protein
VISRSLVDQWKGLPLDFDVDPLDQRHDYGRACEVNGFGGIVRVGTGTALVLAEPRPTAWWGASNGNGGMLIQRILGDDDDEIARFVASIQPDVQPNALGSLFVLSVDVVVMDPVFPGKDFTKGDFLECDLREGIYEVTSGLVAPMRGIKLIVHRLRKTTTE